MRVAAGWTSENRADPADRPFGKHQLTESWVEWEIEGPISSDAGASL
jgi:hypothetical protein